MKIREGFVSNSSSSSFIIRKDSFYDEFDYSLEKHQDVFENLKERGVFPENYVPIFTTKDLDERLKLFKEKVYREMEENFVYSWWVIEEYKGYLLFTCSLDNYDIKEAIEKEFGKTKLQIALEIHPYCGFKFENGLNNLKKIIDRTFWDNGDRRAE